MEKLKYTSIAISSIGLLFHSMKWPYASFITLIGLSSVTIYCIIKIFKS